MTRNQRDLDYIETREGFFFTVIGNVHPNDRVLAYLKYMPNPSGKWGSPRQRYARSMEYYSASHAMKTIDYLRTTHPEYVFNFDNLIFSAVPNTHVRKFYLPESRLNEMRSRGQCDALEKKAIELALMVSEESGVPLESLGITGSILIAIHDLDFSDIDLTVYGRSNSRRVKDSLLKLYEHRDGLLKRLEGADLLEWCREQALIHPLSMCEAKALYATKWNKGTFRNTIFSIRPVKVEEEVEQFKNELYVPQGIVQGTARIVDTHDACFLPATYEVDEVNLDQPNQDDQIKKIVSYESLYADITASADRVVVRGALETVTDMSGNPKYQRILVGSQAGGQSDFMRVVDPSRRND